MCVWLQVWLTWDNTHHHHHHPCQRPPPPTLPPSLCSAGHKHVLKRPRPAIKHFNFCFRHLRPAESSGNSTSISVVYCVVVRGVTLRRKLLYLPIASWNVSACWQKRSVALQYASLTLNPGCTSLYTWQRHYKLLWLPFFPLLCYYV